MTLDLSTIQKLQAQMDELRVFSDEALRGSALSKTFLREFLEEIEVLQVHLELARQAIVKSIG